MAQQREKTGSAVVQLLRSLVKFKPYGSKYNDRKEEELIEKIVIKTTESFRTICWNVLSLDIYWI
jgi:hypothetical protein